MTETQDPQQAMKEAAALMRLSLPDLPDPLPIPPLTDPFVASVTPPGSKSLTNRALVLASLASGKSVLRRPLVDAEDAERMIESLRRLGADISPLETPLADGGTRLDLVIWGAGGRLQGGVDLQVGNAGTAMRFLTAAAILADGPVRLDGTARMRDRPINELAMALRGLGAAVEFFGKHGFPPLRVTPPQGEIRRSHLVLPTTASSQFITALLLIAPWMPTGITIDLRGEITSKPYILMTIDLLNRLGARHCSATHSGARLRVGHGPLEGFEYDIEPDASGATPFWAAAAITPGSVCRVPGLTESSLQGDARFPRMLGAMGAAVGAGDNALAVAAPLSGKRSRALPKRLSGIRVDLSAIPDTAMSLAAACCFAGDRSLLSGLRTLRVKECDRVHAIQTELQRLGVIVESTREEDDERLEIIPPEGGLDCSPSVPPVVFETYDDHRMAMALAVVGLRRPNVSISNPTCVAKTYPGFWADLARLYDAAAESATRRLRAG